MLDYTEQSLEAHIRESQDKARDGAQLAGAYLPRMSIERIREDYGSSDRRMFDAYWSGRMSAAEERFIEDKYRPEVRIGYRPVAQ